MSDQVQVETQADSIDQSQADNINSESQAESQVEAISLDEAKKLRSEAQNLRKRLKDAEATAQAAEAKQREADEAKALEEGNYKQLLEQREAELAEARGELTKRELKDKRQALARKHKVHEDDMELVDLITATDDDEVEAWIKRIAKRSAVTDGLDTDSGKRSAQGNGKQKQESLLANYEFGKRR